MSDEAALRASRDPLAMLALADLLEEQSESPSDVYLEPLRRLGIWFHAMMPHLLHLACCGCSGTVRQLRPGPDGVILTMRRTLRMVQITWEFRLRKNPQWYIPYEALTCFRPDLGTNPPSPIDYYKPSTRQYVYIRERIRRIADYCRDHKQETP